MGDLVQTWSPTLITQTQTAKAELAGGVISLSRLCRQQPLLGDKLSMQAEREGTKRK